MNNKKFIDLKKLKYKDKILNKNNIKIKKIYSKNYSLLNFNIFKNVKNKK
jgi:hypothetical protein